MAANLWETPAAKLPRQAMGSQNAGDRLAALKHWRGGRQGNRPVDEPLYYPWRPLRKGICKTGCYRFSAPLAIHTSKRAGQRKEIQQDEVYLPEMWAECLGEAQRVLNLR